MSETDWMEELAGQITSWIADHREAPFLDLRVRDFVREAHDAGCPLVKENARLREALAKVIPNCDWLHHEKRDRDHEAVDRERQLRIDRVTGRTIVKHAEAIIAALATKGE